MRRAASSHSPTLRFPLSPSRSNLVLVPVLVKSKAARIVFSLTAEDFILTDNGIPQAVRIEEGALGQPLALAVIVQTGGQGAAHLRDYRNLGAILDAVIGGVSHRVAVIAFDSKPRIEQDFTQDTDAAAETIAGLPDGDTGAAILDALNFGIQLLRNQPPAYRRAVLLFSETADSGSQTSLEDAVRAVEDTNTAIYSFRLFDHRSRGKARGIKAACAGRNSLLERTIQAGWLYEQRSKRRPGRAWQPRRAGAGLRW